MARPAAAQSGDGFLFAEPHVSITARGGFDRASAGSDLFTFAQQELTLSRGDFSGATGGLDVAARLTRRLDLVFGAGVSGSSRGSEFRRYLDQNNAPITQTTSFVRVPLTASLKLWVTPTGRSIGRLAWVPARAALYVGGGGGAMWYRFRQSGDFVDATTKDIFTDDFAARGWAPTAHAFGGLDYSLSPRVALTGEVRYQWARGAAGKDFAGFDDIDLSGTAATLGFTFRL
jgi:hypothetical protein